MFEIVTRGIGVALGDIAVNTKEGMDFTIGHFCDQQRFDQGHLVLGGGVDDDEQPGIFLCHGGPGLVT